MLDVSIIVLIFIFIIYTGFISRYSFIHDSTIKILMIIGIIILQFIEDKYKNVYIIVLGTMLVIPYNNKMKECFENTENMDKDTRPKKVFKDKKNKDSKDDKDSKDKKDKKDSKDDKDDEEDDEDGKKSGGLFGGKKNKKPTGCTESAIPKIPPKCANQKIKLLIPDNITIETEKMMTCKTMTDTCFALLDSTKQNDMCSTTPKKSFFSTKPVNPIPANKKDQLNVDNCVDYLSRCLKDGDSVYPGEAQCKNISAAGTNEGIYR